MEILLNIFTFLDFLWGIPTTYGETEFIKKKVGTGVQYRNNLTYRSFYTYRGSYSN
jgi:hypothetical protein